MFVKIDDLRHFPMASILLLAVVYALLPAYLLGEASASCYYWCLAWLYSYTSGFWRASLLNAA